MEELGNVLNVPGKDIKEMGMNVLANQLAVNKLNDILKDIS